MKIKEFYENMNDIISEVVTIIIGTEEVYKGYMYDTKVYEYLFEYTIEGIYIGNDNSIVVEIIT